VNRTHILNIPLQTKVAPKDIKS